MTGPLNITLQPVIDAILDFNTPIPARYLSRLSDLELIDIERISAVWSQIPKDRRLALMEDVAELGERDTLLSFFAIGKFAVEDRDPEVRIAAVKALWEYEDEDLIPIFLRLLTGDEDENVRAAAAHGLGRFVYAGELDMIRATQLIEIVDKLLTIYNKTDSRLVKHNALESLGYSSREEVVTLIENGYYSNNYGEIASSLMAMGHSANERWQTHVLEQLKSHSPLVRCEAARAAGELEIRESIPSLVELVEDPDPAAHQAAVWSLSQIGGEGVQGILEELIAEAEDDSELDRLESALENLTFYEELPQLPLFDYAEEDEGESQHG